MSLSTFFLIIIKLQELWQDYLFGNACVLKTELQFCISHKPANEYMYAVSFHNVSNKQK